MIMQPAQAAEQAENGLRIDVYAFDNGGTGRLDVLFYGQNDGGMLAVCGTYYMFGGGGMHTHLRRAVNGYRIFYNGQTVLSGVNYMNRARTESSLGDSFGCARTNIPFAPNSNDLLDGNVPGSRSR